MDIGATKVEKRCMMTMQKGVFRMKKNQTIVMPSQYVSISEKESAVISGGAVTTGSLLGFISYLLGGLDVSFGSNKNQISADSTSTTSQATTTMGGPAQVGATATHTQFQTGISDTYFSWGASFNLGSFFNALLRLFF